MVPALEPPPESESVPAETVRVPSFVKVTGMLLVTDTL